MFGKQTHILSHRVFPACRNKWEPIFLGQACYLCMYFHVGRKRHVLSDLCLGSGRRDTLLSRWIETHLPITHLGIVTLSYPLSAAGICRSIASAEHVAAGENRSRCWSELICSCSSEHGRDPRGNSPLTLKAAQSHLSFIVIICSIQGWRPLLCIHFLSSCLTLVIFCWMQQREAVMQTSSWSTVCRESVGE